MIPSIREPIRSLITSEATKKLSSELAEEVRQEAGMALLAHERGEQIANPLRWYRRTARFIKYSLNRRRSRQAKYFVPLANADPPEELEDQVDPDLTEALTALTRELERLPKRSIMAIRLRFFDSLPLKEAANRMGLPMRSYQTILSRSLERLKTSVRGIAT